ARSALLRLAADRWSADAQQLQARDGLVLRTDGESIAFGALVRGLREVVVAGPGDVGRPPTAAGPTAEGERIVGRPTPKSPAREVVTGAREYGVDVVRPDMRVGAILRPPAFGATLDSVDVAAASAMPGVVAVVDGDFVGVAAPDRATAERAIASIDASWTEHPQPSEAELTEYLRRSPVDAGGWAGAMEDATGNVDAAFETAAHRLDATYPAAYIAHVPLETRVATAEWEDDGRLTVWTGTQRPFGVRADLAEALGLGEEAIRVIVPDTGGGWGGKHTGEAALEAARLARAAGRPVMVRWTREEEMTWGYFRPFAVIDVRAGIDSGGSLDAWAFTNTNSGANAIGTPYRIPNQRIRYQPADSPLRIGSYRGLAATANTFARETAMDELAIACDEDPLAFRLRHLDDERLATVLRTAAEHA